MRKFLSVILCLFMVIAIFSGCTNPSESSSATNNTSTTGTTTTGTSGEGQTETSSEEEITLKWIGAGWLANAKADTIIERWNKIHPNIKIEYTELGSLVDTDYLKNLDIMIAGGEQVDITYLGVDDMYNRVMNGGALPITEYIKENGDDFVADYGPHAATMLSYNEEIYGVPYANNTYKVFYNKTMIEEADIEIPKEWSYQEFTETAQKLNDPEKGIWGCIFPSTWEDLCYAPAEVSGWHSVIKDSEGNLVPNFDDEVFKTDMQWIYDLAETYKVSPSHATIKAESLNRRMALATGQTAMIIDGPYTLVWLNNYMWNDPGEGMIDFELGVTEMPYITEEGANVSFNALVGAFYVPKTAAHPKEAYLFARFICNDCCDLGNYMPAYLKADMKAAIKTFTEYIDNNGVLHSNVFPEELALGAVSVPHESHISYWGKDPTLAKYYSLMATLFAEQYTLFLGGELNIDEFADLMQELGAAEIANAQ